MCGGCVGGLRLPKVLKNMTNMFPKYNICTGTFEHEAVREKDELVPKLPVEKLRLSNGKRNRLKKEKVV